MIRSCHFAAVALVVLALILTGLLAPPPAAATWGDAQVTNVYLGNYNSCYSVGYVVTDVRVAIHTAATYKVTIKAYPFDQPSAALFNQSGWVAYAAGDYYYIHGYPFLHNLAWYSGSQYGTWDNLPAEQRVAAYPGRATNIEVFVHKQTPYGSELVGSYFTQFGMVNC